MVRLIALPVLGFTGVGLYRIINAESATPTVEGPFTTRVAGCGSSADNGVAFQGTAITRIAFDPNNASRMFVGNTVGAAGLGFPVQTGGGNGRIGLWLSANASAANPTFSLCVGTGTFAVKDIVFEPGSSSNLLYHLVDQSGGTAHGVYRSTNANSATISPSAGLTATRTLDLSAETTSSANGELAINRIAGTTTVLSAHGESSGQIQVSTDGGATWGAAITSASGFCGLQCFYDIAIAIDPTDANRRYLGGSAPGDPSRVFARATAATNFLASQDGLHADTHAIAVAPSNPAIIYTGNDGGIFRSNDYGATWTSLNVAGYNATQFMSLATHPSDPEFMIGGTQDNGTEMLRANGTWTRTDFGDGGFALIDQSSTSITNIRMYHAYFTRGTLVGYATQTDPNAFENWTFRGCRAGQALNNNISCTAQVRFYAPMALGPGTPNPIYFGSDRLYRSVNAGASHATVSQAPLHPTAPISAIGISPANDNVRVVGLENGALFRTMTGSSSLVSVDPVGAGSSIPDLIVARAAVDRNNSDVAYVTLSGVTTQGQVWKTSNLSAATPSWSNASSGIPNIPVNAFVIDPRNSSHLYAGTDIGVYRSTNGGASWTAFSTGLPRTPVFDMAFQAATLTTGVHKLRIATHGRGIWEIAVQSPPSATTTGATSVSRTGATLGGIVNRNLLNATVSFQYGLTTAYGNTVAAAPSLITSNVDVRVSAAITGLTQIRCITTAWWRPTASALPRDWTARSTTTGSVPSVCQRAPRVP
jgi:hypothetical protein